MGDHLSCKDIANKPMEHHAQTYGPYLKDIQNKWPGYGKKSSGCSSNKRFVSCSMSLVPRSLLAKLRTNNAEHKTVTARIEDNQMINGSNTFNYNGPSMNPTLKAGDQLRVVPYANRNIRVGDVVVFRAPEGKRHVTHRVVSFDPQGVRTRGDNNNKTDSWILQTEKITGRVDSARRGAKKVPIHGGRRGMIYALALRSIKRANLTISRILHPAYHRLADSGIFKRFLRNRTRSRVLCFTRPKGIEMQLHLGPWMIGRRLPGQNQWNIKRPFKLFIDEYSLPHNNPDP